MGHTLRQEGRDPPGLLPEASDGAIESVQPRPVSRIQAEQENEGKTLDEFHALEENLKYDRKADQLSFIHCHGQRDAKRAKTSKSLTFNEKVRVVPIPTRHDYSSLTRARIWSTAYEIREMAARNTMEFASEGWDWRTVLEDERMYVCSVTAERIHPCHFLGPRHPTPIAPYPAPKR